MFADEVERGVDGGREIAANGIELVTVRLRMPSLAEAVEEVAHRNAGGLGEEAAGIVERIAWGAESRAHGVDGFHPRPHRQRGTEHLGVGAEEGGIERLAGIRQREGERRGELRLVEPFQSRPRGGGRDQMEMRRHLAARRTDGAHHVDAGRDLVGDDLRH